MTADEISLHSPLIFGGYEDVSDRMLDNPPDDVGLFEAVASVVAVQVVGMLPHLSFIRLPVFVVVLLV